MSKIENPPAFPSHGKVFNYVGVQAGMSLRDYFASQVDLTLYNPYSTFHKVNGRAPSISELADYIAGIRFCEADAMLAARQNGVAA